MASLTDVLGFFMGQGRDRPSIMSPAVEARKRMFGSGRRGKFEPADLVEHLGDPMLVGGMAGIPAAMLGAKLMRRAGASGTNKLLSRLVGSEVAPGQSLDDLAKFFLYEKSRRGAGDLAERVWPRPRMHENLGPSIPLTTEAPVGPTVPGMTNMATLLKQGRVKSNLRQRLVRGLKGGERGPALHEMLGKSPGQIRDTLQEGATPQYAARMRPEEVLDLDNPNPLPQHRGKTAREVYEEAIRDARARYKEQTGGEFGQRQVAGTSVHSSESTPRTPPETRRAQPETVMGSPDLLPAGEPPPGEHIVGEVTPQVRWLKDKLGRRVYRPVTRKAGGKTQPRYQEVDVSKRVAKGKGEPAYVTSYNVTQENPKYRPQTVSESPTTTESSAVETTKMPWVEQHIGKSNRPSKAQVRQLIDALSAPNAEKQLTESNAVMGVPQLTNIARRFVRDSGLSEPGEAASGRAVGIATGQNVSKASPMPSAEAGAPIPENRDAWVQSVMKGETPLQPGQHAHLKPGELNEVFERAAFVSKQGTRAGEEALETVEEGRRKQISDALRDKLTPEEQKAAETGATITQTGTMGEGLDVIGGGASDPDSIYGQNVANRPEQRLSDVDIQEMQFAKEQQKALQKQRQQQPTLPRRGKSKIEHLPTDKQPSELVTKRLPTDERGAVRWTPKASLRLRQAGKEMGSEWDAVAKLRQIADIPADATTVRVGMVDPQHKAMRKLAADPRLNEIVDRVEASAQRAAPSRGKMRGQSEPSERFEELMDWSNYVPMAMKQQILHRMEAKNPAAAARLKTMWADFADMKGRTAATRPSPEVPTPATLQETVSRRQPVKLPAKPKREDLVNLLVQNRDDFMEWVERQGDRSMQQATQKQARDRAALGRLFQEALQQRDVRAVKKGPNVEVFSEHVLGSPNVGFRTGGAADLGTLLQGQGASR